ncbi:MAG TPA: DUF2218 domain-containing protein [Pseudolabrys sp.]|jgi:hypothetical protein|nr:DUF2218 domain-containing protein [Pseudolabrys sp.]
MTDAASAATAARNVAEIATPGASRYLQQLCKHFAHKLPVTFDPHAGKIEFSMGECSLDASENVLTISLTSPDDSQLERLKDVVTRHLVRFAFREDLQIDWRRV